MIISLLGGHMQIYKFQFDSILIKKIMNENIDKYENIYIVENRIL